MNEKRIMTCCVCGCSCMGRQWWNRDTGFGLCSNCAAWLSTKTLPEDMRSLYGEPGVHYFPTKEESEPTLGRDY